MGQPGNHASGNQCLSSDDSAFLKTLQLGNVYGSQGLSEDVVEAALRDTPSQGHLTTLKASSDLTAAAGLLALMTATCGLAVAGTMTAALTLASLNGAGNRSKFM